MIIRHATMDDEADLFRWRNDPVTQASFRSTAPVPYADHVEWMLRNVKYGGTEHIVIIGVNDEGQSVGVLRFDGAADDLSYDVSLTVAPQHRGRGYGTDLLQCGILCLDGFTLNADVRFGNMPSLRTFENCGFELIGRDGLFLKYRRTAQ